MLNLIRKSGTAAESYFTLSPKDIRHAIKATAKYSGTGAYVYYLRLTPKGGTKAIYKVGFSTDYPQRLRSLAREYPSYRIEEVTKMWFGNRVVAYAIEQKLHKHFRPYKYPCTIKHIELYSVDVFNPELHSSQSFREALIRLTSIKNHAMTPHANAYKITDMRTLPTTLTRKRA